MSKNTTFFAELKQNIEEEKKNLREGSAENITLKQNKFEWIGISKPLSNLSSVQKYPMLIFLARLYICAFGI
jgi:hypothetical protein